MVTSEPADQGGPSQKHWWLKMLLVSAATAAALLLAASLPHALLYYHAWQYRSRHDNDQRDSLRWVAGYAVHHRLRAEAIVRLLGRPQSSDGSALMYDDSHDGDRYPQVTITLEDDYATKVEVAWPP
jgi:hypothetical protein